MSRATFNGKYIGVVTGVQQIKVVGQNATPTIPIKFKVIAERTQTGDTEISPFEQEEVWKNYWLPFWKEKLAK